MIHRDKDFSIVNEAEVNVFLEFPCFFYDPVDVGNVISGSSVFSKSILNIWKVLVHILLKPSLENFEYNGNPLQYSCLENAMDGCESWTIKKAEHQRTDAFEL